MEQEIIINQEDNNNIVLSSVDNQTITLSNVLSNNIDVNQNNNQNLDITQKQNQVVYVDDAGVVYNITDVLVNGVSVVSNNIAYVVVPTKLSELQNNVGFITSETDPTIPSYIKQITLSDINVWNNKQEQLVSGTNIKTINNNSLLGSGNITINPEYTAGTGINILSNLISNTITSYNDLTDLPNIPEYTGDLINNSNFVSNNELAEVAFNGSYNALSDTPIIPDSTSELTNDSGFIDKDVNDLTYYTLSSSLSAVATSGNYNDLSNKPTIPTKTSDLTNDSGFITNNYQVYSETETRVGTWIDGKPIYRKVVKFDPSTTSLQTIYNHNISNIKEILPTSSCLLHRTSNQFVPFSMAYPDTSSSMVAWSIGWQVTKTQIYTWIGSNMRAQIDSTTLGNGATAIIEYTKTTD